VSAPCLDGPGTQPLSTMVIAGRVPAGLDAASLPNRPGSRRRDRAGVPRAALGTASASVWRDMRAHAMSGYIDWRAFNMTT